DGWDAYAELKALKQAGLVLAFSAYRSPVLEDVAHIILPMACFAETEGTFVNCEGTWQSFDAAIPPPGEARPGWKILRLLGAELGLSGFDLDTAEAVRQHLKNRLPTSVLAPLTVSWPTNREIRSSRSWQRVGEIPPYASDAVLRRARSLQKTQDSMALGAWLNPASAAALGVSQGDSLEVRQGEAMAIMPVVVSDTVPVGVARIPAAVSGSESLGPRFGAVTLRKA
ncbi:MAG: molybdopterin-dependent oxidoreductase, partial [Pseudomonadota bacterium]